MKKLLFILSICLLMANNALAVNEWGKSEPLGTRNVSDIDFYVGANQAMLDNLLANYRETVRIQYNNAASVTVTAGEVTCSNSDASIRRLRKNTANVTSSWSVATNGLDAGAEAPSTTYYVYAIADADAATFTILVSTNSTAPAGATYYKKLGSFYNDSSSNITQIINDNLKSVRAPVSKSIGTTYQALTDGYVVAGAENTSYCDGFSLYGMYSDNSSSPATKLGSFTTGCAGDKDAGTGSAMMAVKEGDYYKVVKDQCFMGGSCSVNTTYMYFIPLQ